MPIDAKVYRIFIASPRDIVKERTIISEQIARWNALHAINMKMILQPVSWEIDSAPSLEERGQAVINKQVVDTCDLLMGIFWTRLGTPTSEAGSGTVEEIERARSRGKRCMVYFRNESDSQNDQSEYKRLQEYKEELQRNGLINNYENIEDFTHKVFNHITSAVNEIIRENTRSVERRKKCNKIEYYR
jgi:hypothetical protein